MVKYTLNCIVHVINVSCIKCMRNKVFSKKERKKWTTFKINGNKYESR